MSVRKIKSQFFLPRKVAVLGASAMGAQIAALFANIGIETLLFDYKTYEMAESPNALIAQAIKALKFAKPSPLALESFTEMIHAANFEHDLPLLKDCDLIFETIGERLDWKIDLYQKISPFVVEETYLLSHTLGLSIEKLSLGLDPSIRQRFCGVHFFNPPRTVSLVELIPHSSTDRLVLDHLETFLVSYLGKDVIRAKDSPNFICNRIGIFSSLSAIYHAERLGLSPDTVDLLTGEVLYRPKTGIFETLDALGLDTFDHIVRTLEEALPEDPWHFLYKLPNWIHALIQKGSLGHKTKAGVYREGKDEILVVDKQGNYRVKQPKLGPELQAQLKNLSLADSFSKLKHTRSNEAEFLWSLIRDLFHYSAYHTASIAETCRDVDLALRLGFGWQLGPFELWQSIGWKTIVAWIEEDIRDKRSLTQVPLPSFVYELAEVGVYRNNTAYSPDRRIYLSSSKLPVYKRQLYPETLLTEKEELSITLFENNDLRLWSQKDDIAIVSFKTPNNIITESVLEGIQESLYRAKADHRALILWQKSSNNFSYGSNLKGLLEAINKSKIQEISKIIKLCQQTALMLRYSTIPIVAAVQGKVLGSGLELMLHCTRTVAAFETYKGLVEVNIGLIPAGGGIKEMVLRSNSEARFNDSFPFVKHYFNVIFEAKVASNVHEAIKIGYLKETDVVIMNPRELLYVAKNLALMLAEANYQPPLKPKIIVGGKPAAATLQVGLINLRERKIISDHDYLIASYLAYVMCGGEVNEGSKVSEEQLLDLECQFYLELLQTKKTQDRIAYMLENSKKLSN